MVTLVHVYNRWKNSEISCFVNGELASFGDIAWFVNTSDVSEKQFKISYAICKSPSRGQQTFQIDIGIQYILIKKRIVYIVDGYVRQWRICNGLSLRFITYTPNTLIVRSILSYSLQTVTLAAQRETVEDAAPSKEIVLHLPFKPNILCF